MAINLEDESGNSNTLTNNGATQSSDTPFSASTISVDLESGESDNLTAADSATLSQTGNMTIECLVKFESTPSSGASYGIVSKSVSYDLILFNDGGTLKFQAEVSDGTLVDTFRWTFTPTLGTWYHLALTITPSNASATTFELFIDASSQGNGVSVNTGNISAMQDNGNTFDIGKVDGLSFFDGLIDEVRLWSDIRTGPEITNNKDKELIGNEANLVAYYPFEILVVAKQSYAFFM